MNFFKQFYYFSLKGLSSAYYWECFIKGAIVPVILVAIYIYTGKASVSQILLYSLGWLVLLIFYPFSRFVYDSLMNFLMGNTIFITNAVLLFTWRYLVYAILLCFSIFIAPIGWIILFFINKSAYKKAIAEQQLNSNQ